MIASARRADYRRSVTPSGGQWGLSTPPLYCRKNTYVAALNQRVEPRQGAGDDTAPNAIEFYCKTRDGDWVEPLNRWEAQ